MSTRPNILVLVLDSVRARNTSLYGYSHRTTPFLERLAETATTYRFAYAPSTTSISSHVCLFTGLHEDEHRVYGAERTIDKSAPVWARLRDERGYATGLFTINPQFERAVGLRSGFETEVLEGNDSENLPFPEASNPAQFDVPEWFPLPDEVYQAGASLPRRRPVRTLANGVAKYRGTDRPTSDYLIDAFLDWSGSVDGHWAAFMNLMDAHSPYEPRADHNRWGDDELRRVQTQAGGGHFVTTLERLAEGKWWEPSALEHLYDGAIHQADAKIRRVVERLQARDEFNDTLVVVTADHGEGFGEPSRLYDDHHVYAHSVGVHEVQAHVPLIVSAPDQVESSTVDRLATLTRLPDAVESAVKGAFDPGAFLGTDGRVLVSRGSEDNVRHRLDDGYAEGERIELPDRAYAGYECVDGTVRKYCRSGDYAATVRVSDAQGSEKLADDEPGVADWFPGVDSGDTVRTGRDQSVSEEALDRLEQFGYVR